jgi:predicted RNA-binding Zn-ribbon protein involved in translation (DUF1610 family)
MKLRDKQVNLLFFYGKEDASYRFVADTFNAQHPKRSNIDQSTDWPRSSTDDVMVMAALGKLTKGPIKSTRNLSQQTVVGRTSVQQIQNNTVFTCTKCSLHRICILITRMQFCRQFSKQYLPVDHVHLQEEFLHK